MILKHFIFILSLIIISSAVRAQSESDALLLSRQDVLGTARYTAMGGAFSALGGDPTGTLKNPAGIAVYRDNEVTLTPIYGEKINEGTYYGNNTSTADGRLGITSFSIAGSKELRQQGKWRSVGVSFGINRVFDFHENYSVNAQGVNTSILDDYTNIANDLQVNANDLEDTYPFDLYLLWGNYLLETYRDRPTEYFNRSGVMPVNQNFEVESNGAKRETYFNVGFNYDDKLYLGGGISRSNSRIDRTTVYSEEYDERDTTTFIREFSQGYYEEIEGRGWSATIGAIYRPIDPLRVGLSLRSPEIQSVEYRYETDNITVEDDGVAYDLVSPYILEYDFRVISPFQTTLGLAYVFKKFGLLSVDLDYIDYRMISMSDPAGANPFGQENNDIERLLTPTLNIRTGLEYRITPFVSVRAGYAKFGDPYNSEVVSNGGFDVYSLGAGYRIADFFIDASYQYRTSDTRFYIYDANLVEPLGLSTMDHRIALTFGLKI